MLLRYTTLIFRINIKQRHEFKICDLNVSIDYRSGSWILSAKRR